MIAVLHRIVAGLLIISLSAIAAAQGTAQEARKSGFDFMTPETQAMQRDDMSNPGMLAAADGEALWNRVAESSGKSCASCHGDAARSMRGVAARYPAFNAALNRPIDLQQRINLCRSSKQDAAPFEAESDDLLALMIYVSLQSRGMPIAPDDDARLASFVEHGKAFYEKRRGQLNLSCAQCHDDLTGKRLGGSVIPPVHPTGYPLYRLEWQKVGSLQRRFRNCLSGVRAQIPPFGDQTYVDLELFLKTRARGMPVETPAVRP